MNSEQLINDLLKNDEDDQLEFKERVNKDQIGSIICSFLNNKGGQVLIGVSDKKEVIGLKDAEKLQKELEHFLIREIVPETPIVVSIEKYQDKELILIKVWSGSNQPYIFKGNIFYRRGERTVQASSKEISKLIHNRQISEVHWERRPALGVELEDLDLEEIQKTIDIAISNNKIKEDKNNPLDFLSNYGLFKNGNFTNAAVILFAKTPTKFLPQLRIRVAYLGKEGKIADEFLDSQIFEDNLFKDFNHILDFMKKNLNHISTFNKTNWLRNDDLIYPMMALREGVLNALIHRDYSNISGSVSIIIYPDKLEITNTGHLQLRVSELKKSHQSILVNPDIAHIAFLRGYIDKIGRGTLKIIDSCKEAGLKSPEWATDSNSVKLTFFKKIEHKGLIQTISEEINQVGNNISKGINEIAEKGLLRVLIEGNQLAQQKAIEEANYLVEKKQLEEIRIKEEIKQTVEKEINGITDIVKDRMIKIIQMTLKKPGIKTKEFVSEINVSERTIKENLKMLVDLKIISYQGSNKTGGYYLEKDFIKKIQP